MGERARFRDINNDERQPTAADGAAQFGFGVIWRRAQRVLLSAQGYGRGRDR